MNLRDLVTPCFIYDIDRFELNINCLRDSFKRYYGNFRIGYSYKTNYFEPSEGLEPTTNSLQMSYSTN